MCKWAQTQAAETLLRKVTRYYSRQGRKAALAANILNSNWKVTVSKVIHLVANITLYLYNKFNRVLRKKLTYILSHFHAILRPNCKAFVSIHQAKLNFRWETHLTQEVAAALSALLYSSSSPPPLLLLHYPLGKALDSTLSSRLK